MKIANAQIDFYIQKIAEAKIAGCLVYGPESSVVSYRFNLIAKKISPDLSDPFLVSNLSKERLSDDKALLSEEFLSFSMLGGRKLIIVKDCDVACAAALKLLTSDNDFAKKSDNFILIQGGDLDKSSPLRKICEDNPSFAAIACYEDDERNIKSFIDAELKRRSIVFTRDVVEYIYEKLGKNRQIILSEIDKIEIFLGENKTINVDLLAQIIELQSEISVNEFVLNFAAQKFSLAAKQLQKLIAEGEEAITLIRFLGNYLQKLYQAKQEIEVAGSDFEEVVKAQRLFFKTEIEFRKHLKILSREFLQKILLDLSNLEIKIKSGAISPRLAISAFVTSFVKE